MFFFDTKPDSMTWKAGTGANDTLLLWLNSSDTPLKVVVPDSVGTGGNGGAADSTFKVITATDYFRADTISAPSDTSAGIFYFDKEDSNFYFFTGLVWMPMDTGATVTEGEIEDYIFNDDPGAGPDNYVQALWKFDVNPQWNNNAIPNAALQETISQFGRIIETGEVKNDAINDLKIDWGTGTNQINLTDVPDQGSYVKMTDVERDKLNGIETEADKTDATSVEAAGAIMDGDFGASGIMRRTGTGIYDVWAAGTYNPPDWNTAYGWGDHSTQNYFDRDTDDSDSISRGTHWWNEDSVTLADVQSACTNDFHNIGGTDDDQPDNDDEVPDSITVGVGGNVLATATVSIEDSEVKGGSDGNYLFSDGIDGTWKNIAEPDLPEAMTRDDELLSCDSITENLISDHADSNRDLGSDNIPWSSVYADSFFGDISNVSLAPHGIYPDSIGSFAHPFAKGYFDEIAGTTSHSVVEGCTVKATEAIILTGYLEGSSSIRGLNTFDANETADTVVISGATTGDYYWIQTKGSAVPSAPFTYVAGTGTLFVYCAEADTSIARASGYNWLKIRQ